MKIWICIPVFNRLEYTKMCIRSLMSQTHSDFEIVVSDDGSTDGTSEYLARNHPEITVLRGDGNLWWTGAINDCISSVLEKCGPDDYVLTLNNDLEVRPDYLSSLATKALRYTGSIISSVDCDIKDGRIVDPGHRHSWYRAQSRPVDPARDCLPEDPTVARVTHASGRGTLFPVEVFKKIGLYDRKHFPHYGADYDLTFKAARMGFPIFVSLDSFVYSHVKATGLTQFLERFSFAEFLGYLTHIKSPANLKVRWWISVNNCPHHLLPSHLVLDFLRVVGGYFKRHIYAKP